MLPIKEDDKFFSRLLSKESSTLNSSFRVYYGENSVGVPFVWEAKPGTPKNSKQKLSNFLEEKNYIPPLTPPPSYYINQTKKVHNNKKSSRVFQGLFPKMIHKKQSSSISLSSSPTLSSMSSSSSMDSTTSERSRVWTVSNMGFGFQNGVEGHDEDEEGLGEIASPKSVMCFGIVGSRKIRSSCTMDLNN